MVLDRGLAYWPANLPTRTTGFRVPRISTRLIWRSILSLLVIASGVQSLSVSAQSPPWRMKRLPWAASARSDLSRSISHEVTSGGSVWSLVTARCNSSGSWYSGCCAAFLVVHDVGDQFVIVTSLIGHWRSRVISCENIRHDTLRGGAQGGFGYSRVCD